MSYIILAAVYLVCVTVAAIRPLHMFQLESYQPPGYYRWLRGAGEDLVKGFAPIALFAVLGLFSGWTIPYFGMVILLWCAFLCRPKKGAKKPFVLTPRLWRQWILLTILQGCLAALGVFMVDRFRFALYATGFLGVLIFVPLSGYMNLPFQKLINARFIGDAKRLLRSNPDLIVIGVTGSYGKTSVKFYLEALLGIKYNVFVTPESYNTPMGIVRAIREGLRPHHQIFICEMGARHVGDIRECCNIVRPKHGIITAVGPQHLETFGSLDNVAQTKFELCRALPADGICFVNWGSEGIRSYTAGREVVTYGIHPEAQIQVSEPSVSAEGSRFSFIPSKGESYECSTMLLGRHNVENLCGAMTVAWRLGVAPTEMLTAVRGLRPVTHRLELRNMGGGVSIIDDAFNANPAGTAAALDVLALFDGMKVMITPGLVELGAAEEEENKQLGRRAATVCDRIALVGEKRSEVIRQGILESGEFPKNHVKTFDTFEKAFAWARSLDTGGGQKTILLENDLPDNY